MSFGNSHSGGRTRMKTKVLLNVYDLSPANDYLYPIGFGLHHSGVEIMGREYSFGSGSGVFESSPREAGGARFRFQLDMGTYDGGSKELNEALDDLRAKFGPNDYNLVKKNCNSFCNALVWKLLGRPIPAYVNRLADIGNCCECLLPKQLTEDSPVGGGGGGNRSSGSTSSSFLVPTTASMNRGMAKNGNSSSKQPTTFSGRGHSLGGTSDVTNSSSEGLLSKWKMSSSATTQATQRSDDLVDRREKARMAALARLERNQQQQQQSGQQQASKSSD